MYSELFNKCIPIILVNEGGYSDHPNDSGGKTNYGIADAADGKVDGLIDVDGNGTGDVKPINLTKEEAIEIFYRKYWILMKLDKLTNEELVLHIFDMGINAGPTLAIKLLQRLLKTIDDGIIGKRTIRLINEFEGNIVEQYKERRILFYSKLAEKKPTYKVFLQGWINRVNKTKF